jgi:hypothetical protein
MTEERKKELASLYCAYVTEVVNDFDYDNVDGFDCADELEDEEWDYVLGLRLKVVENNDK